MAREAIILGCTIEFGFFEQVQREVGVPVIDPVVAAFKMAEAMAGMKQRFGWSPSRVGSCEPTGSRNQSLWPVSGPGAHR